VEFIVMVSVLFQLHTFSGDLLPSIAIATFFYLAFETPYLLVENYFYQKFKKSE
jgi:hypothetical protein